MHVSHVAEEGEEKEGGGREKERRGMGTRFFLKNMFFFVLFLSLTYRHLFLHLALSSSSSSSSSFCSGEAAQTITKIVRLGGKQSSSSLQRVERSEVVDAFHALDGNQSGSVSAEELRPVSL